MSKLLLFRLVRLLFTLFLLVTLVFIAIRFIPGDPATMMLGASSSKEVLESLRKEFGVDQPLYIQYINFIKNLLKGDLGFSWRSRRNVIKELGNAVPYTLELSIVSMIVASIIAVFFGIISAINQNTFSDNIIRLFVLMGFSIPVFILGIFLIYLFSFKFGWFPISGAGGIKSLILPATTLGLFMSVSLTRLVRVSMLDVLRQNYVIALKAKGLSDYVVIYYHVFRNALIPIVTALGMQFGLSLGGSVITETVFAWPGMGRLLIWSINSRDIPLVQGCVLLFSCGFLLVNFIVDLIYFYVDPRIRALEK